MPLTEYSYEFDEGVAIAVTHETDEHGELVSYAAVLLALDEEGEWQTVRVYDNHLDVPHMHRYTRSGGKQPAEKVSANSTQDGYNMALEIIREGHERIIEAWRRS